MKRVVPVLIVLLLIVGVAGSMVWKFLGSKYMPEKEYMDYASELGLGADEYAITLNHELLGDYAGREIDGRVYLPMDLVTKTINSRFYWNEAEQQLIFTTPTEMEIYKPLSTMCTVQSYSESSEVDAQYEVVKQLEGTSYVAADFVKLHTCMDLETYTDPNRIVAQTSWGTVQQVKADKVTNLRYKGGIKSEILREIPEGEKMVLIEAFDDWTNVVTEDGYVGWIETKDLGSPSEVTEEAPAFDEPVYTSIHKDYKINMAWHQVMSKSAGANVASVLSTIPGVNTISPTWYYFQDESGAVISDAVKEYVDTCHAAGVEVWALFSNEFTHSEDRVFDTEKTDQVLGSTEKRSAVIHSVIEDALSFGIDGINVDFELISADGADDYVEFIRELSIGCRANNLVLSVDNYVPKYSGYLNRREQGIVADYVVIMGYDETTAGSETPGPTASQSFVREGISDTLAVVDKSKVINGMPLYTRVWSTTPDGAVSSFACGMTEALGYLTSHGVTPAYREDAGLNYGSYTSDVDGNIYEIWLQDADAVTDEVKMAMDADLAGVASWKIGFESGQEIWTLISSYLQ